MFGMLLQRLLQALALHLLGLRRYVQGAAGDMVERGMIIVAIVAVTLVIWLTIGDRLAAALNNVAGML